MPVRPNTKLHRVLAYLQANGSATKEDMKKNCHYSNGGDAVFVLRERGYIIETVMQKTDNNTTYALYVYRGVKVKTNMV